MTDCAMLARPCHYSWAGCPKIVLAKEKKEHLKRAARKHLKLVNKQLGKMRIELTNEKRRVKALEKEIRGLKEALKRAGALLPPHSMSPSLSPSLSLEKASLPNPYATVKEETKEYESEDEIYSPPTPKDSSDPLAIRGSERARKRILKV